MKKRESNAPSAKNYNFKHPRNRPRVTSLMMALAREPSNKAGSRRGAYGFHPHKKKGGKKVPPWLS